MATNRAATKASTHRFCMAVPKALPVSAAEAPSAE
jgi:hypothetical protein